MPCPPTSPDFTFSHQRLTGIELSAFAPSFQQLPPDPHIKGDYRLRRYSQLTGHPLHLRRLDHQKFELN